MHPELLNLIAVLIAFPAIRYLSRHIAQFVSERWLCPSNNMLGTEYRRMMDLIPRLVLGIINLPLFFLLIVMLSWYGPDWTELPSAILGIGGIIVSILECIAIFALVKGYRKARSLNQ